MIASDPKVRLSAAWLAKHRTGYYAANPAEVVALVTALDEARALLTEEQETRAKHVADNLAALTAERDALRSLIQWY